MLLSIIIVSYNTEKLTKRSLISVFHDLQRSAALLGQTEILVIDNASTDSSVAMLRRLKKQSPVPFKLIGNKDNPGFAGANNTAIQRSTGKYVLLLNPDTYVQAGCLQKLVYTLERLQPVESSAYSSQQEDPYDRVGILAATLLNTDGTIQDQGGATPSLLSVINHYWMLDDIPILGKLLPTTQESGGRAQPAVQYEVSQPQQLIAKGWVGGTAMLIRRAVFSEIGFLDEHIFMYGEDVEFCLRARAHHWDVVIHPTARVTHIQSASAGTSAALVGEAKGYSYIWAKHMPSWQQPILTAILRIGALLRMVLFTLLGAPRRQIEPYEHIWHHAGHW